VVGSRRRGWLIEQETAMQIRTQPGPKQAILGSVDLTAPGDVPGLIVSDFGSVPIPPAIGRVMAQLALWERQQLAVIRDAFARGERVRDLELSPELPTLAMQSVDRAYAGALQAEQQRPGGAEA
jgi:hypothetical protein